MPVAVKFMQNKHNSLRCLFVTRMARFYQFGSLLYHELILIQHFEFQSTKIQRHGVSPIILMPVRVPLPGQQHVGMGERRTSPWQRRAKHPKYALHFLHAASILEWKIAPDFLRSGRFTLAPIPHSHFT